MATGFYLDKNSVWVRFRQQYNGKTISLFFYPNIIIEDATQFTGGKAASCTDRVIDKKLLSIRQAINDVIDENNPFDLNNDLFTQLINEKLKPRKLANKKAEPKATSTPFFTFAERFVAFKEANKGKVGNKDWASFRTTVRMLKTFRPKLTFEQIDRKFNEDFLTYMQDTLDSGDNHIAKMFSNLKRILDKATDDGINTRLDYLRFDKKKRREAFNVYLNEKQLLKLFNMRITASGNPKQDFIKYSGKKDGVPGWTDNQYKESVSDMVRSLENVRKLAIIGCWTGLRGGNFLNIDPETQITWSEDLNRYVVSAISNKGTGLVRIPAHDMIKHLYESDTWPYNITKKTYNEQIKILGRVAGFNEPILLEKHKGGKNIEETKPFYKLITTHTSRRSFCSNCLISGMPKQEIMSMSGHTTEISFNKYTAHISKDIMMRKSSERAIWDMPVMTVMSVAS
jgi:hypothetical protein